MEKEVELFDKRFVHFMWDDELEGKEVIAANYISSLREMVENGGIEEFGKSWDKVQKGIVSRSEDDEDFPFRVGGVDNALAYYDPNYEAKRAYYKEGKEIVCYNPNLPLDDDEPCWLPCPNPTWEDGLVYRLKEEECEEDECPCEDGIDSKACVGCPEDEKRKERHLPTWTRSWDKCAGCRHEEKMSDEEPCSSCFLDGMKYEPAEKKAEPSFRPFKDCDELVKFWSRHYQTGFRPANTMPLVWVRRKEGRSNASMVTGYGSVGGEPCVNLDGDSFGLVALFEDFEFLDGEPCGVKE